jgi:hypothetical protein
MNVTTSDLVDSEKRLHYIYLMKIITTAIILLTALTSRAQWITYSEDDPFDGKETTIIGTGYDGRYPYRNPSLVFRRRGEKIEAYITDAGSLACEQAYMRISFGDSNKIIEFKLSPSVTDDSGFFDTMNIEFTELIKGLKSKSLVYVDFNTRCSNNRFKITLKGSNKALSSIFDSKWSDTRRCF